MNFVTFARAIRFQLSWAVAMIALAIILAPQRSAAQIQVNTTTPGDTHQLAGGPYCSLQEAIYAAEFGSSAAVSQTDPDTFYVSGCAPGTGSGDTILLQSGSTYTFNALWDGDAHNPFGPTATPIIFRSMTIQGNGATLEWKGSGFARLFAVGFASVNDTLDNRTVSGTGSLTLQNVYVTGFKAHGGNGACGGGGGLGAGGAIYVGKVSSGTPLLTVQNSTFQNNSATGGNGSYFADTNCTNSSFGASNEPGGGGGGGLNGNGGATPDSGGSGGGGGGARGNGADAEDITFGAGAGGTVFDGVGFSGGYLCGGDGGGNNDGHSATCPGGGGGGGDSAVTFQLSGGNGGNGAYGGGGGGAGVGQGSGVSGGDGGSGGFGGGGGGSGNNQSLGTPKGGNGGFGGGGGAGFASALGGPFGANGNRDNSGGGGALGGAIFNDSGTVLVQNSTFTSNAVFGGTGGSATSPALHPADNGSDGGAAIFSRNGSLTVQNATISGNRSTTSAGGVLVINDGSGAALTLDNTIIANNGGSECLLVNSVGAKSAGNLILSNGNCPAPAVTSDPQLGVLQMNSPGDTPTMAIQYGVSPAVDAGDDATALATDQRGVTRPQGAHADIGAYEAPPPSADLSITKGVSSSSAQPGDTLTYTLTVSNAGPNTANTVSVSDTLSSYLTFVSCSESTGTGTCTYSGGTVSVTYASMAANASSTVTINTSLNSGAPDSLQVGNSASVSASDPTDPNTANNTSANVYFTVHNRADLAVTKSVSSTSPYGPATGIEVGDPLTYTVTLTNKGPYDAKSVVLSDAAPAGVTFTGCTVSVGTCVWSASSASLSLSSFANASVATLTIQAKLNFGVADGSTISNTGSVTSTTNDPDPTNNAGSASFTALNKSDLFLTQSVGKLVNQQLTFTVSVKNLGPYQAKQLLLNDAMPNGTKFVSVAAGPWTCTPLPVNSTGTLSCSVSTLNLNAIDSLSFTVKVTTTGKNITNTATVGAATSDPNLANNTATLLTKSGAGK